ncbi:MAG: hypothetical protein AAGF56_04430 [Pseudomonadota bacterium]
MIRAAICIIITLAACAAPPAAIEEPALEAPVMLMPMEQAMAQRCPTDGLQVQDGIGGTGCR